MKVIFLFICLIGLNALAGIEAQSLRLSMLGDSQYPRIEKSIYECAFSQSQKATDDEMWNTAVTIEKGTSEYVQINDQLAISTDIDVYGRLVTEIKKEQVDNATVRKTMTTESFDVEGNLKSRTKTVRTVQIQKGLEVVISNIVDGKDVPYTMSTFSVQIDAKTTLYTQINNRPELMNNTDVQYSRMFYSCVFTVR